jgi:hypothetical protein
MSGLAKEDPALQLPYASNTELSLILNSHKEKPGNNSYYSQEAPKKHW